MKIKVALKLGIIAYVCMLSTVNADNKLGAFAELLQSPALPVLTKGVDMGKLAQGYGFKGMLSTFIESPQVPPAFQPKLRELGPYIPPIISDYYECGGQTETFHEAMKAFLSNPQVQPLLNDPNLLESPSSTVDLPELFKSAVTDNPPMYNWLLNLQVQCITDKGYVQPAAVILSKGTPYGTIAEYLPKLVDDYYNAGCTTEQFLAFAPILLEAQTVPPEQQTQILFQKQGQTPSGVGVGFSTPFNGGPSILQCFTPNLSVLTTVLQVGK